MFKTREPRPRLPDSLSASPLSLSLYPLPKNLVSSEEEEKSQIIGPTTGFRQCIPLFLLLLSLTRTNGKETRCNPSFGFLFSIGFSEILCSSSYPWMLRCAPPKQKQKKYLFFFFLSFFLDVTLPAYICSPCTYFVFSLRNQSTCYDHSGNFIARNLIPAILGFHWGHM
jgi:hypothetical protein